MDNHSRHGFAEDAATHSPGVGRIKFPGAAERRDAVAALPKTVLRFQHTREVLSVSIIGIALCSLATHVGCSNSNAADLQRITEAARKGDDAALASELQRGFDAREFNKLSGELSESPLHSAAREGHADAVRMLLNAGVDVYFKVDRSGCSSFLPQSCHEFDITPLMDSAFAAERRLQRS